MYGKSVGIPGVVLSLALVFAACQGQEATPPDSAAPEASEEQVAATPSLSPEEAAIERGRYLVEGPGHCTYCHSEVDWEAPGFPEVPGRKAVGAPFIESTIPGHLYSPNITPDLETGVGAWTDEELGIAIREGLSRDGTRLFPVMPYLGFAVMSDQDLSAVIAYLRSLEPANNLIPARELPQPLLDSLPPHRPIAEPVAHPDEGNPVEYGAYLATIGNCVDCHTPFTPQGQPIMELAFSGGRFLDGMWGTTSSANITPAPSGIPHYDESLFISTMRTCRSGARELHQLMPCRFFNQMTDGDLAAIFAWLQTLEPVQHRVSNTDPPTPCKLCGGTHGLGDMN